MNRTEAVDQLKQVYTILNGDVNAAVEYGNTKPSPFAERMLVRAHFALVDGLSYQLRQVTLASLESTHALTNGEVALLSEQRYSLDNKGFPSPKEAYEAFLPNLLFCIRMYAKNHGAEFEADTGVHGWEAMKQAIRIRDRLTHPKSEACLTLSDKDTGYFIAASEWWNKTLLDLFQACAEADARWLAELGK
jgi:hypothetical protein